MTTTFNTPKTRLSPTTTTHGIVTSSLSLPLKHWSQTCHETILISNDPNQPIELSLGGGAENGEFIYLNESISILKNKTPTNVIKGGKN